MGDSMSDTVNPRDLQRAYWTFDANEMRALDGAAEALTWPERLRLHHLLCMAHHQGMGDVAAALAVSTRVLLAGDSPYQPRPCAVWQWRGVHETRGALQQGDAAQRPHDFEGVLYNASLTHLGCLEVVFLNVRTQQPSHLGFVPFDDLHNFGADDPDLFRVAKLFYETHASSVSMPDAREEIVLLPLLYGLSWHSPRADDQDGSRLRFEQPLTIPNVGSFAIGIGQQAWAVRTSTDNVIQPLGHTRQVLIGVTPNDPRYAAKAALRRAQ
jgi:hypothetical protein